MPQQYEPRIERNRNLLACVFILTHIASKNGGECFIQKIDNRTLCINVNRYGMLIEIIRSICHRIIYVSG